MAMFVSLFLHVLIDSHTPAASDEHFLHIENNEPIHKGLTRPSAQELH